MTITSYLLLSVGLLFVMVLVQALTGIKQFGLEPLAGCLLYTSPSPRDLSTSRMPSSA